MDTRVLLANTNKRFESIFQAINILDKHTSATAQLVDDSASLIFEKLLTVEAKLDAVMAHLGIELLAEPESTTDVVDAVVEPTELEFRDTGGNVTGVATVVQ